MNMNRMHRWYCGSMHWRRHIQREVLPHVLAGVDLFGRVLEIGPGRGAATEELAYRAPGVVAVELDGELAVALHQRLRSSHVRVVRANGTALPFADGTFDVVVCTTMLHHVPTPALQDGLLAEAARVLRQDGRLVGSDNLSSLLFRLAHVGDVLTPVRPESLPGRLTAAGLRNVAVERHDSFVTFRGDR
jgi:SAM-dependent methyltransferase